MTNEQNHGRKIDEGTVSRPDDARHLLELYLQDHYAGSAGGVRLIERSRESNAGTAFEPGLARLDDEIHHDQVELRKIMEHLAIEPSKLKEAVAWGAATLGGLNGRLTTYSPLSRVVELEALTAAVSAKLCLWMTLGNLADEEERVDKVTLTRLRDAARAQLDRLAEMHRDATRIAFESAPAQASGE